MDKQKGFSIIELLVAVTIILIIAVIAITAFRQARQSAYESAAVSNLRSLASAEFIYAARNNQQFGSMADMSSANYMDSRFSSSGNTFDGFQYTENYAVQGLPAGTSTATPNGFGFHALHQNPLADMDYEVAMDGVVRYGSSGGPTGQAEGTPLGNSPPSARSSNQL
ncbi:MAG: prepilin-type N-terminal cleavage/methylation domain-containing protein [Acidobacteria bacterium]|nr:prepilin-type N-terminal cleavage/methylation domain-containing protein [Acidobacteriota bacterium]MBI3655934.1 prepilin-type N-terminal cleavage/methylation domain-containing protein [Acidobacteriota bacterium]